MTDMPRAQDQQIISTLLKAYEHKEIRKLKLIGNENSKILTKLNVISCGKELAVGHHLLHEQSARPKTLHIDRNK